MSWLVPNYIQTPITPKRALPVFSKKSAAQTLENLRDIIQIRTAIYKSKMYKPKMMGAFPSERISAPDSINRPHNALPNHNIN
jgi:hypothetical protein